MLLSLRVNGRHRRVEVRPETPLLWVLRDVLGLRGTKLGCGAGQCGACTVQIAGVAHRSCVTAVSEVGEREVTTIEGLGGDGLHPCQRAWLDEDVAQCGYCQPGMLMEAAALLRDRPHPTDAEIDRALGGHLCRCGTYQRIRRAVHRAAGGGGGAP